MTCTKALALARRGDRATAAAHLTACATCTAQLTLEEQALAVARTYFVVDVPAAQVDRIVAAALATGAPRPTPWWELALPIAWRAAAAINIAGVVAIAWLATRPDSATAPHTSHTPALAAPFDVEGLLDDEADAMLGRALGLAGEAPP